MNENTATLVSSVLVALIGVWSAVLVARINARASAKKEVNSRAEDIMKKARKAFADIKDINKKIENGLAQTDRAPTLTERINRSWIEALTEFVETFRVKVDVMELFGVDIPADFYYNFAVYYAFIRKDWITGKYFIDKTIEAASKETDIEIQIAYLRWAARINRLNRNETEAIKVLTKMINTINATKLDTFNDFYKARLYRSRGFCYFNTYDFGEAIQDFGEALRLIDHVADVKMAYCHSGLAMATYRQNKRNLDETTQATIVGHYQNAIDWEPCLGGKDKEEFWHNLERLENEKTYYFSELEKDTLEDVYDLYQKSRQLDQNSLD